MLLVLGDSVKVEVEDSTFLFKLPKGCIVCSLSKRDLIDCTVFQTSEMDFAV